MLELKKSVVNILPFLSQLRPRMVTSNRPSVCGPAPALVYGARRSQLRRCLPPIGATPAVLLQDELRGWRKVSR